MFNGILPSGIFPTAWAVAVLVPVFKRGHPEDPSNYRGISLVSNFGKLFTSALSFESAPLDWPGPTRAFLIPRAKGSMAPPPSILKIMILKLNSPRCVISKESVLQK